MSDPFESPDEVLRRAREHIDDLASRIKSFFDRAPYVYFVDYDKDTGQDVHKVRLTAKLPGSLATVAKDVFSNLRDCLDHAVYASAVSVRPERRNRRTAFPFAHDAAGVHDKLNLEFIDVPPNIRTLLENLRPYKGGNDLLWGLNQTRNTKTHRVLIPLGAASVAKSINIETAHIVGSAQIGYSKWDATKNEVEFMRVGRGSNLKCDVSVSFDVLFDDVEVLAGQPAVAMLNALASEVEGILTSIKVETARMLSAK